MMQTLKREFMMWLRLTVFGGIFGVLAATASVAAATLSGEPVAGPITLMILSLWLMWRGYLSIRRDNKRFDDAMAAVRAAHSQSTPELPSHDLTQPKQIAHRSRDLAQHEAQSAAVSGPPLSPQIP